MADLPHCLTLQETAAALGATPATVLRWQSEGVVPAGFKVGSRWRFVEADIAGVLSPIATK
jgi:predicted site-specific integrase-resolvase